MGVVSGRTVTFLFTDVVSSTQRWQDDAEDMAAALLAHDAVLDRSITAAGGRVFKHTGDGVCAVFESASRAAAAARDAQRELELPVRMGLHTGEAEERDGDFFGPTLNRCARIMTAGHGGQVLVSAVTRALLDDGIDCVDLGQYVLKGLVQPEQIFQVGAGEFPVLRAPRRAGFLPSVLTSLVGRDELVVEVVERLRAARLLTLVGTGGVGKTRVALAAAEEAAPEYDLGVFVDLTEVSDDEDVVSAFARALGISSPTRDAIGVALSGRRGLVVLDNCEHVLDAVADLVVDVLEMSPSSRVLATSREGLAVDGEHLVEVPALDALDVDSAGVALFGTRARDADASFVLGDDVGTVQEICRRLDGLPLAIELAAARVGVLSATDLLGRLDGRFEVLTGGRRRRSRDGQRTLRDTVDWSYRLLDPDEQRAFATLSVFAGSFGLDGASAVLDAFDDTEVLDLVEALAAKSLLAVADVDGFRRYRYLETLRSYAEERLAEHDEAAAAMLRLHHHLCTVVIDSVEEVERRSNRGAARLRIEIPNLRRVFEEALDRRDIAAATAIIAPFMRLSGAIDWHISGWAAEVLALDGTAGTAFEPELLALHAVDRWLDDELGGLHHLAEQMLERAAGLGEVSVEVGESALWLFQLTGDDEAVARLVGSLPAPGGSLDSYVTIRRRVAPLWTELVPSRPRDDQLDDGVGTAIEELLHQPSELARGLGFELKALFAQRTGNPDEMLSCSHQAEQLLVEGSANWFGALQIRAWAQWELGRMADAIRTADDDLDQAYRYGDRSAMIIPLAIYALVLRSLGEPEAAATVRGHLPRRLTILLVAQLVDLDRWLSEQLEPDVRAELSTRGGQMDPRELQALTHAVSSRHLQPAPAGQS